MYQEMLETVVQAYREPSCTAGMDVRELAALQIVRGIKALLMTDESPLSAAKYFVYACLIISSGKVPLSSKQAGQAVTRFARTIRIRDF